MAPLVSICPVRCGSAARPCIEDRQLIAKSGRTGIPAGRGTEMSAGAKLEAGRRGRIGTWSGAILCLAESATTAAGAIDDVCGPPDAIDISWGCSMTEACTAAWANLECITEEELSCPRRIL